MNLRSRTLLICAAAMSTQAAKAQTPQNAILTPSSTWPYCIEYPDAPTCENAPRYNIGEEPMTLLLRATYKNTIGFVYTVIGQNRETGKSYSITNYVPKNDALAMGYTVTTINTGFLINVFIGVSEIGFPLTNWVVQQ